MSINNPVNDPFFQEMYSSDDVWGDIKKVFFKYLAHWKWFVFSIVFCLILGFAYIYILPPQYRISASILIKDNIKTGKASLLEDLDMSSNTKVVENEIEILRSYNLLDKVVDDLNLQVQYSIKDGWKIKDLYGKIPVNIEIIAPTNELFSRPFSLSFEGDQIFFDEKPYARNVVITESFGIIKITSLIDSLPSLWDDNKVIDITFLPKEVLVGSLRNNLHVSLTKNTSIVNLSMLSPVPQRGKDILNQLIIVYNHAANENKNNMAEITLNFINERLMSVGEDLAAAEHNVEQYRTQKGITDISAESSLFLQNIQKNDSELSKVSLQLEVLKQIEQYVLSNSNIAAPASLGLNDPTLVSLITALTDAEAERIKLLSTTQPGNLKVKAIDDQIKTLKEKLIDNIRMLRRSLEMTQRNLRTEIYRMESHINAMPKKERELVDFTRQQGIINQLYVYLLSKREETAISYAATIADSPIIDEARSTPFPVQPRKNIILIVFGLIGFLMPVIGLWMINLFNTSISSKDELENLLKAPLIAEISFVNQQNKIVVFNKSRSRQAEQIRTLRTNIQFMRADGGIQVILITSSIGNEGKSFLSANIGAAFASMGKKTIMLGFDLRKPGLDTLFGINNEDGLCNYLSGQATLDQIIFATEQYDNLHIITCGHIAPNPQELLLGNALPTLIEQLRELYDYIVIDTSPIGLMSDAMILDRFADVTLYVVRQNYTPKNRIKYINELFDTKRLNNFGVVVNGIKDTKWDGYGYSYGYSSSKYYANYYGSGKKRKDEQIT